MGATGTSTSCPLTCSEATSIHWSPHRVKYLISTQCMTGFVVIAYTGFFVSVKFPMATKEMARSYIYMFV